MKSSLFALYISGPALALLSCAPGKSGGGIGCSKTSSVLKTPTIISTESTTAYDSANKADEEKQRSLFFKHYGQFKAKTTGGYVYIRSRAANDVMGNVAADAPWHRCSVMLEFPKHTGEIPDPSVAGSAWYGKTEAQIAAERFPAASDLLKVRIYSAAHCFDYSINEDVVLSVFSASGQDLPSFKNAYTNIALTIPELKAVKDLRTALAAKVAAGTITNQNAVDILKAFQPAVRNMNAVFDVPAGTTEMSSPTPKQSCMLPPKASEGDNAKQYTCATYHDMVVHDV
ncbi:MAG: hypothetical protein EBR09_15850, partial [Proteobacteria bacterium]|nr:hypothetical protein [Pseudomonadota bacterium]